MQYIVQQRGDENRQINWPDAAILKKPQILLTNA